MAKSTFRRTLTGTALVNLGCGERYHPEWNNLDFASHSEYVRACNIARGIPYPEACLDAAYSSHFLEHLVPAQTRFVLSEIYRVLKKGGIVRTVVPDLEYNTRLYLECLRAVREDATPVAEERYRWALLNLLDQMVRVESGGEMVAFFATARLDPDFIRSSIAGPEYDAYAAPSPAVPTRSPLPSRLRASAFSRLKALVRRFEAARMYAAGRFQACGELHKWMYDSFTLSTLLAEAGFSDIRLLGPTHSGIPEFSRFALDVDSSGAVYKPNSLFVEARK